MKKRSYWIIVIVAMAIFSCGIVGGVTLTSYADEKIDGEYYACPGEKINVKTYYDPTVTGDIVYTFSGCDSMTVTGSWPNYTIRISEPGTYRIKAKPNFSILLDNTYIMHIGHDFSDSYTVDKPATCTEDGIKSFHCKRCNATTGETSISAPGHMWETEPTIDVAPTCTADGFQSVHCSNCDAKVDEERINKLGHDIVHHKEISPYTESGWYEYDTCSRCDYSTYSNQNGYGIWMYGEELNHNYCTDEWNSWVYDPETGTLTILKNYGVGNYSGEMPCIYSLNDLTIDCAGHTYSIGCVANSTDIGVYSEGKVTIKGGGKLSIESDGNPEFAAVVTPLVSLDGTELYVGISSYKNTNRSFTGIFSNNVNVKNDGRIEMLFGMCESLVGIKTNNTGGINIEKGNVIIKRYLNGNFLERDIDCGFLTCNDGTIRITGNGYLRSSIGINANTVQLIKGGLEVDKNYGGVIINAERIVITPEYSLNLPNDNKWSVTPIYYPADLEGITIQDIPDQEYTGRPIEPMLDIRYGDYVLPQGENEPCIVSFENNTRVGRATAKVSFYDVNGNSVGQLEKQFSIVGCEHTVIVRVDKRNATCTSAGNLEYYKCKECGNAFKDSEGHEKVSPQAYIIPATGHNWTQYVSQNATEFSAGVMTHRCTRCGASHTTSIPAITLPTDLPGVKMSKPKGAKGKITVKWKKPKKKDLATIQGIEIRVVGPGVDTLTTAGKKKTSKKIGGLMRKQGYTVQVRTYAYIGGVKHVSAWSTKSAKTK